ncbi:MAG: LD-carboxypeptidase [Bacteroidota bacterium]|nr:LD-carboxypeptidase [Bacteroidota bacterium]
MNQPPFLEKGDKIGIVAPARSISFEEIHPSIRLFQKWGLEVILGTHIFDRCHQYAGTDHQRRDDLQQMLDDPSIRAILCARGGYGTVRIIDGIDFTRFKENPKWIVGYSDITVLHSHIYQNYGIETLHATMPFNIKDPDVKDDTTESLRKALFGENIFYRTPITFPGRTGLSEGILVGGNLSILYSLMGSESELDTNGKILFIEDVDEYLYHIDRMMQCLKRAGKLDHLKGLIAGRFTDMRDNTIPFGMSANEIISETLKDYSFPICFDFPAGHGSLNFALYHGRKIRLIVDREAEVTF